VYVKPVDDFVDKAYPLSETMSHMTEKIIDTIMSNPGIPYPRVLYLCKSLAEQERTQIEHSNSIKQVVLVAKKD
jgi:hypothetical protein